MDKEPSEDLRWRLISAVEAGMSCRRAAVRFGVSASSAVRRVREWRDSGRTAPRRQGGDRLSGRIEAHADFLLARIEAAPDRTLEELRALLARDRRHLGGRVVRHDQQADHVHQRRLAADQPVGLARQRA